MPRLSIRNSDTSDRGFGSTTTTVALRMAPARDFRPPSVTASRNSTANSKVKVLGAMYSSENANRPPARPASAALMTKASTLYRYTETPMQSAAAGLPRRAMKARPKWDFNSRVTATSDRATIARVK